MAKIPEAARSETAKGAEAFALFYMKQVNEAFVKADSRELDGLSKPGCNMCEAFIESAVSLAKEGQHHRGLSIEPTSTTIQEYDAGTHAVLVWTTQHSVAVVDREDKQIDRTKAGEGAFLATLVYDGHWWIKRLQVAE